MLKKRLLSALVIVPSILGAILFMPSIGMLVILIGISTRGLIEYSRMLERADIPTYRLPPILGGAFMMISAYAGYRLHGAGSIARMGEWQLAAFGVAVIGFLLYWLSKGPSRQSLAAISSTVLGFVYIPFLLSYFMKLAVIGPNMVWNEPLLGRTGCYLIFYVVFVSKFTDTGAFFVGRQFGRRKLAPELSPGKTVEGAIGGLVTGTLTSVLFLQVVCYKLGEIHVSLLHGVVAGVVLSLAAIAGDLVESVLKRSVEAKDSATSVPGLGGLLDIFDSMIFAVPAFYFYTKAFLI
jgi:phosphatidate cytidylyltransferase